MASGDRTEALLASGAALLRAGRLFEAERAYREVVVSAPDDARATHYLGITSYQKGERDEGLRFIRRSTQQAPHVAELRANLGEALLGEGAVTAAARELRHSLVLAPNVGAALARLGAVSLRLGRWGAAAQQLARATSLSAEDADARHSLGIALSQLGNLDAARASCRRAVALSPAHAEALNALAAFDQGRGHFSRAAVGHVRTLSVAPMHVAALPNAALALRSLRRTEEAFRVVRRALVLHPWLAQLHVARAAMERDVGSVALAVAPLRRALCLDPTMASAHSALLMSLLYLSSVGPAELLAEACAWNRRHAAGIPRLGLRQDPADRSRTSLRLGLLSGDLRRHPVGFFLAPVLPWLDRDEATVHCYSTDESADALTAELRESADVWRSLAGLDDDRAAAVIASDGIDVLFDLSGHTAGGRLLVFARRPAPVQAAWIGYFGTTGVTGIDWLVADRHVVPPSHDRWYSEKVIRLPDGYVCYRPSVGAPDVSAPPSDRNGYVTFGSCNAVAKVTPEVVGLWAAILRETGGSRLLLKAAGFDTPAVAARIRAEFATHGIDESRLELEGWSSYEEFLGTYSRIDVAVDPFPFGGGLTTVETLWAGVPLVTYAADRFAGRQSTSHLSVIGHQELVAQSLDQYRSLAIALGGDPDRRRQLRATLRQDMARSPLCDGERFARNLQRAIRGMWESRS